MVGGDGITDFDQHACAMDRLDRRGAAVHVLEERRQLDVGGGVVPFVQIAGRDWNRVPFLVRIGDAVVVLVEQVRTHRILQVLGDFLRGRPDVFQVHILPVAAFSDRLGGQVDIHGSGQGIGDHKRRRSQVIGFHVLMDAAFKVAVARQHACDDEVSFRNGFLDGIG